MFRAGTLPKETGEDVAIDLYMGELCLHFQNSDTASLGRLVSGNTYSVDAQGFEKAQQSISWRWKRRVRPAAARRRAAQCSSQFGLERSDTLISDDELISGRLDGRLWMTMVHVLEQEIPLEKAYGISPAELPAGNDFWGRHWDRMPGVSFARAVDRAQSIIIPGSHGPGLLAGNLVVSCTAEAEKFLSYVADRWGLKRGVLSDVYDEELSEDANVFLCNLRLLNELVEEANLSGRPFGIWG